MFEKKYIFRLNEKLTRDEVLETVGNKFYHDGIVTTGFVIHERKALSSGTDSLGGIHHCSVRKNSWCTMSGCILFTYYIVISNKN